MVELWFGNHKISSINSKEKREKKEISLMEKE